MSLATRCPACGTVFRVVPDQLKVSEGWVRCGRCNSMFSAAGLLFDIDSGLSVRLPGFAQSARPRGEEPSITDWTGPSDEPVSRPRVAATPARAHQAEASIQGQPWSQAAAEAAGQALRAQFQPISDMRASAAYRREVLGGLMRRFWLETQGGAPVNLEGLRLEPITP